MQQVASVNKILSELNLNEIPQLVVLNKTDLIDAGEIEALRRQIKLDTGLESVAISAIRRETLRPFLEEIGKVIRGVSASAA